METEELKRLSLRKGGIHNPHATLQHVLSASRPRVARAFRGSRNFARASVPLSVLLHLRLIGGSLRRRHARLQRRAHIGMHIYQPRNAARRIETIATRLANPRDMTSAAHHSWIPNDSRPARAP